MKTDSGKTVGQLVNELSTVANQLGQLVNTSANLAMGSVGQATNQTSEMLRGPETNINPSNQKNLRYTHPQEAA